MTSRCARLVLVVVLLGVVSVGVVAWEPVWQWATTKNRYFEAWDSLGVSNKVRGYRHDRIWGDPEEVTMFSAVRGKVWYMHSGYLAQEWHGPGRMTWWEFSGELAEQWDDHGDVEISSPPWLWSVTDQTTPSMPAWMKDDEQWQRALDAQD